MDLPASSAASSSAATPSESSHRSCSSCRRRMSSFKYDKHTICSNCREIKCDLDVRCKECADWSYSDMEDFLKRRRSLESKSKKKSDSLTTSSTVSQAAANSSNIQDVQSKPKHLIEKCSSDRADQVLIPSFSASLSVPGSSPFDRGDAGGLEDHMTLYAGGRI